MCRYCASKVGTYSLAVTSSRDGEHLAGSPFQFDVTPGQLSPCHCTATLASAALVAGEEAAVTIDAKDMHGNQASFLGSAKDLCLLDGEVLCGTISCEETCCMEVLSMRHACTQVN